MREVNLPDVADSLEFQEGWTFSEQPRVHTVCLEPVTAGANADDDVAATLVGVIPTASRLIGGYLVASINSGGIDGSNTSVWTVAVGGTTYISKSNTGNLTANTAVALSTPVKTDIAAGSAVTLAITNGTSADLNSAICHVSLILADQNNFPSAGLKTIATDGGTVTVADGASGGVALSPGSADNDEIYVCGAVEKYKFASGKSFVADALIQFSEANTDDANVCFGFMSTVAANSLIDNAGGPQATGDYALIWKVDGGTQWLCGVQSNGTQTPTTDAVGSIYPAGMTPVGVTAGGSTAQRLTVKVVCESSTAAVAEFYVDGQCIGNLHFTYASATEMALVVGVKNGSANAETLNIKYLGGRGVR